MILEILTKKTVADAENHLEYNMDIEQEIKNIIAKQFDVDINALTSETDFNKDLGADSLDTVEIVLAVEERFGIEVLDESTEKILTIGDIVRYLNTTKT